MIVLGIDTSAYANAVGVVDDGRVLSDHLFEARSDSLQKIVANVDSALKSAGLALGDVRGFGVGLGPGSWTGIRVGVTVAKMLAYATGRPVCGVSTLEVLAYSARDVGKPIVSVIGVGAGEAVYAGLYDAAGDAVARCGDYYVGDLAGLSRLIKGPTILAGPEAETHARRLREASPGIMLEAREGLAGGAAIARLAAVRLGRGESDDALALAPLYLKESTAKVFVSRYSSGLEKNPLSPPLQKGEK